MTLDASIRASGFRRWYVRQLYESHAYLVTGLLSLIMMAIAIEVSEFRSSAAGLVALIAIAAIGGGLCVFAWRRFNHLLFRAEYLAERATCAACGVYARFELTSARAMPRSVAGCSMDVRCRACGHAWTIE
jgi:hypothetical protein